MTITWHDKDGDKVHHLATLKIGDDIVIVFRYWFNRQWNYEAELIDDVVEYVQDGTDWEALSLRLCEA